MTSFTSISFSSVSFDVGQEQNPASTPGKRNRFRAWIASWARDLRNFFKIKPRPPEPEDIIIPVAQPPKTVTILASPPTMETRLETLNDKWIMPPVTSAVASIPPPVHYPMILNPLTAPLIQKKVTLPRATRSTSLPPYRVAEGSHIESQFLSMKKPENKKSKAAAINTLMLLLDIESKI